MPACHVCGAESQRERDGVGACRLHALPPKKARKALGLANVVANSVAEAPAPPTLAANRPQLGAPAAIAAACIDMQAFEQEHFRVFALDTKNRVLLAQDLYIGTVNSAHVRIAEVFREAIRVNAVFLAVAHNHPSGDPTPSPEDARLTRDLVEAGTMLGIEVLDSVVIGRGENAYVSMRERGLGFRMSAA